MTVLALVEAYLDEAASSRRALGTFLGGLVTAQTDPTAYWLVRKAIERELRLRVKAGKVAMVRSVGGRRAFIRTSQITPQDAVLHRHR